jgi:CheY-like chemotaxis protein
MDNPELEILLAEDNTDDRELTIRSLRKHNLANRLLVAKDGAEALDLIFTENHRPKVVLLDLKMPKVDGLEVLRLLRADERTRLIPVVMLTSSAEHRDIVESYRLGANSYIVKPVEFENFAKAVADLGLYWLLLNKSPPK